MTAKSIMLGGRRISAEDPCYIIAEIGVNHNGSVDMAHQLIDLAADAGADAVKFQTFRTDALLTSDAPKASYQEQSTGKGTQQDMLRALELPIEAFAALKRHCVERGVDFMSTAFDEESLQDVGRLSPVCLKWPSGELDNIILLRQAASMGLPVLLSTGMGSVTEISTALDVLRAGGCDDIVILQCVSRYPSDIEEQNLRAMANMSPLFGVPVGFSDHTIGPYAAIAARALGMAVLEKHFTLDCTLDGPDHAASIEPKEFKTMVDVLRRVEISLGDGIKRPLDAEANIRAVARKSLVYKADLPAGHVLNMADLSAKRPGSGLPPSMVDAFVGRVLSRPVMRDALVAYLDVR